MGSKLILRNNLDNEFTIEHQDGLQNKTIKSNDIAVAVDTIDDLPSVANTGDVVIVRDMNRGGTFVYDATKSAENNGGTVFDGWVRQYSGAVNVKWFGAKGDGVTDDTLAIQSAIDSASSILIPNEVFKITYSIFPKSGNTIYLDGEIFIDMHGYTAFYINGQENVSILSNSSGVIRGHGVFPDKNFSTITNNSGEKGYVISENRVWPQGTNDNETTLGAFGGGFIGNGGHGVFIVDSSSVLVSGVSITGFNYGGITISDPSQVGNSSHPICSNIKISDCYLYDIYDNGIGYFSCDNVQISGVTVKNIGHPDSVITDTNFDPGYGFTGRLVPTTGGASRARNVSFFNCYIETAKSAGFDIHSGENITASDIVMVDCWKRGTALSSNSYYITLDNIRVIESGTALDGGNTAVVGALISGTNNQVSNLSIVDSGVGYGVYFAGTNLQATNINISNNENTDLVRPLYFTSSNNIAINGLRISGTYQGKPNFNDVYGGSMINIDTSGMTVPGTQEIEFTGGCDINVSNATHSRPFGYAGNSGHVDFPEIIAKVTLKGTITEVIDNLVILKGAKYLDQTSPIISGGAGQLIFKFLGNTGTIINAAPSSFCTTNFGTRTDIGTSKEISYIQYFPSSNYTNGSAYITPRDASGNTISVFSNELIGTELWVKIKLDFCL